MREEAPNGVERRERRPEVLEFSRREYAAPRQAAEGGSEVADVSEGRGPGAVEEAARLARLAQSLARAVGVGLEESERACAAGRAALAPSGSLGMGAKAIEDLRPFEAIERSACDVESQRARIPVMCSPRISVWTSWVPS